MPIATEWEIEYACGHTGTVDLSKKPAGERASLAEWYAKKVCFNCYRKKDDKATSADVAAERERRRQEAQDEAERFELPILVGSDKQKEWALTVRHDLLRASYEELVQSDQLSEEEFDAQVLAPARRIDRAHWWIDNRATDPADVRELLADAGELVNASTSENPF